MATPAPLPTAAPSLKTHNRLLDTRADAARLCAHRELTVVCRAETFRAAATTATAVFKSNPSVVHFSGFQVGQKHTLTLVRLASFLVFFSHFLIFYCPQQLLNAGAQRARYHLFPPTTDFFTLQFSKKVCDVCGSRLSFGCQLRMQDFLGPGAAEEITIEFTPTEWRYYYDCIRIHSQACAVRLTLAYPA